MAGTSIFSQMTALATRTGAINLGQGFPDVDGPAAVIDAAARALAGGHNQYAPPRGVPALREAVAAHQAEHYGLAVDPETGVQITFGATEAIAAALLALVGRGDEVLALDPTYDSYGPIVQRAGGRLAPIALDPPHWRLTTEALERAVTPAARILLLNSPHNPTGRVLARDELELLAATCIEHDLIAICDEVYEHLVFGGAPHIPLATLPGMAGRTLMVSSLGKTFSLTGWKVGWASGPAELVGAVHQVKQFLSFSGGTPLQHAAAAALRLGGAEIDAARDALRGKRDRLAAGLAGTPLAVLDTEGTYFLNVDAAPLGEHDAQRLCLRLPEEAGVVAIPVSAFRADPGDAARSIVRLAFCKQDAVLDEAARRLRSWAASERQAI